MLAGSPRLWRQQDLIQMEAAAAAKLVQVGQLLSGTVRNARESRLLDVHGGQVLFLPGTVDVSRDACLKLGFLPTTMHAGFGPHSGFFWGLLSAALRLSLEHMRRRIFHVYGSTTKCLPTCEL